MIEYSDTLKIGQSIKCMGGRGINNLTNGKVYHAINGLEVGLVGGRPYITVIGDDGKQLSCHASRFELIEEQQ